jgi:hypothetical protein
MTTRDTFFLKRGDTGPALQRQCLDEAGDPLNITGATVRFSMRARGGDVVVNRAAASIVDAATGIVRYAWQAADTDEAGAFDAEFEITYLDGSVETVPNAGMIEVTITGDIA